MDFAKLFQVEPNIQVVVLLKVNENEPELEDRYTLTLMTDIQMILAELVAGFKTEKIARKQFEEYDIEKAREWAGRMKDLIADPTQN